MTTIHRLLDDAFAGVELTPDVQDLKEEVRANLVARAAEIEASGAHPDEAARRAVDELGDVRVLIAETTGVAEGAEDLTTSATSAPGAEQQRPVGPHQVRRDPRFVVGVVLSAMVLAAMLGTLLAAAGGRVELPAGALAALIVGAALTVGLIVRMPLGQETAGSYPMPRRRAVGYGVGVAAVVAGAGLGLQTFRGVHPDGVLAVAAVLVVAGVSLLAWYGATQTNRHKPWRRAAEQDAQGGQAGTRFDRDPDAAARFGIYTVVIWVCAAIGFVVLGGVWSRAWAWLVFPAAFAGVMVLLATMLFGDDRGSS